MQVGVYTLRADGSLVHELERQLGVDQRKPTDTQRKEFMRTAPACPCAGTENPRTCTSRS